MIKSSDGVRAGAADGFIERLARRRSIRRYTAKPVPALILNRLFQAMAWGPSAHNRQPWRVAVIEDVFWKVKLATTMGEQLRAARSLDGDMANVIEADVNRSFARITEAPAVLIVCVDMSDMDVYPDERRRNAEYLMAVQSVAMASQNLLLAADSEGLGACWLCAPLFCQSTVAAELRLPSGWQAQSLITLGWPANGGKPRSRRSPAEFVWRPERFENVAL